MNELLFDGVNSLAGNSGVADSLARFLANDGIFVLGGLLAVLGLWELRRNPRFAVFVALAAGVSLAITGGLILVAGHIVIEQRPFVGDRDTVLLIKHAADNGFPSDHAAVSAAVAVVGMLAWPRWAAILGLIVVVTGIARVVVGVHFPGDVVAGWVGGSAAAGLAWVTVRAAWSRVGKPVPVAASNVIG